MSQVSKHLQPKNKFVIISVVRLRESAQSSVLLNRERVSFLLPPLVGQRHEARFMELSGGKTGKGGKEAPRGAPGLKQEMLLIEVYLLPPVLPSAAVCDLGAASPGLNDSLPRVTGKKRHGRDCALVSCLEVVTLKWRNSFHIIAQ